MIRLCLCLIMCWLYAVPHASAQKLKKHTPQTFRVNGNIPALKDSTIYLFYIGQPDTVLQRVKVSPTGRFTYFAKISEPTRVFVNTKVPGRDPNSGDYYSPINFWAEPGKTTLLSTSADTKAITAIGNQTQTDQNEFNKISTAAETAMNNIIIKGSQAKKDGNFSTVKPRLDKMWDSIQTSTTDLVLKFIQYHPASYVSLSLIKEYMYQFKWVHKEDELITSFYTLSNSVKSSKMAYRVKEYLGLVGDLRIGARAKNITSKDVSGNFTSLSSFEGKYVLLEFWASWCVPCRAEIPALKDIYDRYVGHNFTILSVSLDENRSKWLTALKQENMSWKNISDLKGFDSIPAQLYNIHSIPSNVLIDPAGKIIAKNITGENLSKMLADVLK